MAQARIIRRSPLFNLSRKFVMHHHVEPLQKANLHHQDAASLRPRMISQSKSTRILCAHLLTGLCHVPTQRWGRLSVSQSLDAFLITLVLVSSTLYVVSATLEAIRITLEAICAPLEAVCAPLEAAIKRFRSFEASPRPSKEGKEIYNRR